MFLSVMLKHLQISTNIKPVSSMPSDRPHLITWRARIAMHSSQLKSIYTQIFWSTKQESTSKFWHFLSDSKYTWVIIHYIQLHVFPDSSVGKESACNVGDPGLIPESGRSAGEEIGYPLSILGLPCNSAGKESTCNVGDLGSIPGLGRSHREGKGYPLQ